MKKGFTLIELLAVIVILAIIALIVVPIILNIIDDVNKNAFKETINGIVRQTESASVLEQITDEKLYKYENNAWGENKLEINGTHPKYIEVKINKEGKIRYAITDGSYCALKEYDGEVEVKKVPDDIKEQYCKLDVPQPTNEECFDYTISNKEVEITVYYEYEGNDSSNEKCPSDVIIPSEINGYKVTKIGTRSFNKNYTSHHREITSVIIPEGVTLIGSDSFLDQKKLTTIVIPKTVTKIGSGAFWNCGLTSVEIPEGITEIGFKTFDSNYLTTVKLPTTLKTIGKESFSKNNLNTIIIPEGVTTIGNNAFSKNLISDIIIPSSVTSIGDNAFSRNDINTVKIKAKKGNITLGSLAFNNFNIEEIDWVNN